MTEPTKFAKKDARYVENSGGRGKLILGSFPVGPEQIHKEDAQGDEGEEQGPAQKQPAQHCGDDTAQNEKHQHAQMA